jgi:hypothetical protein
MFLLRKTTGILLWALLLAYIAAIAWYKGLLLSDARFSWRIFIYDPVFWIVAIAIIMQLLAALFLWLMTRYEQWQMSRWIRTMGTIIDVDPGEKPVGDDKIYKPHIVYSYDAKGHGMEGNKHYLEGVFVDKKHAEEALGQYAIGSAVPVAYNSKKPHRSTLVFEYVG